jgi:hypothetical protein
MLLFSLKKSGLPTDGGPIHGEDATQQAHWKYQAVRHDGFIGLRLWPSLGAWYCGFQGA